MQKKNEHRKIQTSGTLRRFSKNLVLGIQKPVKSATYVLLSMAAN